MINFLLTNWWIYIPIIGVLLFLTLRNNQKAHNIKREQELKKLTPEERPTRAQELARKDRKTDSIAEKYGLRGILDHIFPKK